MCESNTGKRQVERNRERNNATDTQTGRQYCVRERGLYGGDLIIRGARKAGEGNETREAVGRMEEVTALRIGGRVGRVPVVELEEPGLGVLPGPISRDASP